MRLSYSLSASLCRSLSMAFSPCLPLLSGPPLDCFFLQPCFTLKNLAACSAYLSTSAPSLQCQDYHTYIILKKYYYWYHSLKRDMLQVSSPCDLCLLQHEQPRMGNKGGSKSNNGCGKCKSNLLSYNLLVFIGFAV